MAKPTKIKVNGKPIRHKGDKRLIKWKIRYRKGDKWTSGTCWARRLEDAYAEVHRREQRATDPGAGITWSEGLDLWIKAHSKAGANYRADSTREQYERNVLLLIDDIGNKVVSDTTRGEINRFLAGRAGVSGVTGNRARCVIALANWLRKYHDVQWAHQNRDFPVYDETPKRARSDISIDDIPRYLDAIADRSIKRRGGKLLKASPWVFRFLFLTGVRSSEAASLREKDVEEGNHHLRFTQKGRRERVLPVDEAVMKEIRRSIRAKRRLGLKIDRVFFNCAGRPWNRGTLRRYWIRRIEAAGLPHRTPHEIRHTFCTIAGHQGFNIFQLQSATGHETASVLERYVHNSDASAADVGAAARAVIAPNLYPNHTQKQRVTAESDGNAQEQTDTKTAQEVHCPHCGNLFVIKE